MIIAILTFGLIGCVTTGPNITPEVKVTLSYEGAGAVLETALPTLQALCANGTINAGDCAEAKVAYNEAAAIYKFLGDLAGKAVDTGDDSSYTLMSIRLMALIAQIQGYGAS